jgi:hypothetical protein
VNSGIFFQVNNPVHFLVGLCPVHPEFV